MSSEVEIVALAEEAIAVLRRATDSALFRGDEELATALVCGINAIKTLANVETKPE